MQKKRIYYWNAALISLCLLTVVSGCGEKYPPTAKVTGTVTHKGKPLAQGTIIFEVDGRRPATGKIVDGKIIDVTTFKPNDGVSIGTAKIAITSKEEIKEENVATDNPGSGGGLGDNYMGMGAKSLIAPHYGAPSTSNLTTVVEKGKENVIILELE
ncbi:MAG: hypothetical protein LBT05_15155 [Planctomycetaceae bacterium]|jgi:hypothetical protein|nr:hypothetical protein [Planctomycetaceae bacterium]